MTPPYAVEHSARLNGFADRLASDAALTRVFAHALGGRSWSRLRLLMYVVVLYLATVVGCGNGKASLPGAVYAGQVAVYPSAVYDGAMGGDYSEEVGGPVTLKSQSWFFKTDDAVEKVIAFYEKQLPSVVKSVDEEGEVTFTLIPAGAEQGEDVVVRINPGKLHITERFKLGKRKR